jgi:hypothetical protein
VGKAKEQVAGRLILSLMVHDSTNRDKSLLLLVRLLVLGGGALVVLVLGDEVVHVGLGLGELHLVRTLTGEPVEEGLAAEHDGRLLADTLQHLLDGDGVAEEGDGHPEALGGCLIGRT